MTATMPAPLDVKLMNMTASVLFTGCVLLAVVAGVWWLLRYPGFAITRIVVEGDLVHNNAITLRANVGPHLAGNFFTLDLRAARDAFEQVPWVRRAEVRRVYPGSLAVELQEHEAVAYWGSEAGGALVNQFGEVFEANTGEVEQDGLPRLVGPAGSAQEVLQMHVLLNPVFKPLGVVVETLELKGRGGWRVTLDTDAVLELGGGTPQDVVQRTQRFARTLPQVAAQYGRRVDALELADLRHSGGYALRMRGVTTVVVGDVPAAAAAGRRR